MLGLFCLLQLPLPLKGKGYFRTFAFMKRSFIIFCLFAIIFGSTADKKDSGLKKAFNSFLKKFKPVQLPITIMACRMPFNGWDTLQDSDALFISDIHAHTPFYRFKVNNNCIGVIFSEPADCDVPALATFDTNGNKIDQKDILVGRCGGIPEPEIYL